MHKTLIGVIVRTNILLDRINRFMSREYQLLKQLMKQLNERITIKKVHKNPTLMPLVVQI